MAGVRVEDQGSPVAPSEMAVGDRSERRGQALDLVLGLLLPAVLIAGMYLYPFLRDRRELPFGADTFGYLWRAELVRAEGIGALTVERTLIWKTLGERPAYPVLISLFRSTTGASSLELLWVLPATFAAALAIAAAGVAREVGERWGWAGVVGIAVAASVFIARTAVGYTTNLIFDVIALTGGMLAVRLALGSERRGWIGGALVLAGGALYHWLFALLFAGLLVGMVVLTALGRWRRQERSRPAEGSALRIAAVVGSAAVVAVVLLVLITSGTPNRLPIFRGGGKGVELRLPSFALWLTLPAAAVGAAVLFVGNVTRRWALALLVPWAGVAVAGLVGWYWLDLATKPYRFAGFALGIPLLIVLGARGIERLRPGPTLRVAAATVTTAVVVVFVVGGLAVWWERPSRLGPELFAQLEVTGRYVGRLDGQPMLLLPYSGRPRPLNPVRAGLPVGLYGRTLLYRASDGLPEAASEDRVIVHLDGINRRRPPTGSTPIADGVSVVEGPTVSVAPSSAPLAPAPAALFLLALGCLVLLGVAGGGWARVLTDLPPAEAVSASPAFGLATLGLVGTLGSWSGVPLRGGGAVAIVTVTAAGGWAAAWIGRHRRGPEGVPSRRAGVGGERGNVRAG